MVMSGHGGGWKAKETDAWFDTYKQPEISGMLGSRTKTKACSTENMNTVAISNGSTSNRT